MAENKIEDALEKANEILDDKLNENLDLPFIDYHLDINYKTQEITTIVKVFGNDYVGTKIRVRGHVLNTSVIELEDLDVDKNGYFWLTPSAGTELTEKNTFEFAAHLLQNDSINFEFDVIRVEDSIVLCEIKKSQNIEPKQFSITVNPGSNCNGAKLSLYKVGMPPTGENTEEPIFEFSKEYKFNVDTEVLVVVEKEGFNKYMQTINLTENIEITVDLEPAKFSVKIVNSNNADSVDCHIITSDGESNHIITNESDIIELEYGTKIIVTAKKEGYKDFKYTIDSLDEDTVIDVKMLEKVSYNLTVKVNPEDAIIFVNGTRNDFWPLKFAEGTNINVKASKNHYVLHNSNLTITEDTILDISLEKEQHTLTVLTMPIDAIVTLSSNGVLQQERQIQVPYITNVKIKVESEGFETVEKTVLVTEDTTEHIILEPKKLKLTVDAHNKNILDDATIFLNDVKQESNVCDVVYGETIIIAVNKPGYPKFEQQLTLTEDIVIYLDDRIPEWRKPKVSVSISNKQDISNPVVITINDKPVSDGVPVEIDYETDAFIKVICDGYKTIEETKLIIEDYSATYELVDVNSNKVKLNVECNLEGSLVTLNGEKTNSLYIEPGNEVTIVISHNGYETITELITVNENTVKTYNLNNFTPKEFTIKFNTKPYNSLITVNNILINNKQTTAKYLDMLNVVVSGTGYLSKKFNFEVVKNDTISVELEFDSNFGSDGEVTLDQIIEMIKFRKSYSYLEISRVFKIEGFTESAIKKFYEKFGPYCVSRYDYKLWDMMHTYFK